MGREIDEIKSRIDIVDIVSEHVKLTQIGANHKGLCPFHNEKTPSFMVNQSKQMWRCFGCGEGGDMISFFMKAEGLEFGEALKLLAKRAGVVLPSYQQDKKDYSKDDRLFQILDLTAKYWNKIFMESSHGEMARDYVSNRKVSEESIVEFKIGYSIEQWDNLIIFLKKKGFNDKEIFSAGLSVQKNGGGFYDRFRGRLMFPITDIFGRVVGFGGRNLKNDDQAKYINSPQGEVYNKSAVLYGLDIAKTHIKKKDLCILVEGYMDVIPSHQMGIKNVVSISGTALTQEQIVLIKRFTTNLSLALDMDLAGQNAAQRSADLALANEMNVNVILISEGKDPGECATNNPKEWERAIENSIPVMEYFLDRAIKDLDLTKPENKKIATKAYLQKIISLPNKIDQEYWLKKLADKISVSENILWEMLLKLSKAKNVIKTEINTNLIIEPENIKSRNYQIFQRLLTILIIFPKFTKRVIDELSVDIFDKSVESLYKKLIMYYTKNIHSFNGALTNGASIDLFDSFRDWMKENDLDNESGILLEESFLMSQNDKANADEKEYYAELSNIIKILKTDHINSKLSALKAQLEDAEKKSDRKEVEKIYAQLSDFIQRKALLE